MWSITRNRQIFLTASLLALSLRALTPDGYMPGSAQSGLLYELCPDGMPPVVMQALAGDGHHHHHGDDDRSAAATSEQCPIGHMLASAVIHDTGGLPELLPETPAFDDRPATLLLAVAPAAYRSRAPPA